MEKVYLKKINSGYFVSDGAIDSDLENKLLLAVDSEFKKEKVSADIAAYGRAKILKIEHKRNSYVLRIYRRGGVISNFNESSFFKPFKFPFSSRPYGEFETLQNLRSLGIKVPKPVACILKNKLGFLFRSAIVLEELKDSENLLNLIVKAEKVDSSSLKIAEFCFFAGKEALKVLDAGVLHVDLHPGNVLIQNELVFLIDFDKSKKIVLDNNLKYQKFLIERWLRSLNKRVKNKALVKLFLDSFSCGVLEK